MRMKLKRALVLFMVLTLVIMSLFSFSASAIMLEHDQQYIASQQTIGSFTVPSYSSSKSWTHTYQILTVYPYNNTASANFGISKGGITSADDAMSWINNPSSGVKMLHTISRNFAGNNLVDEDESIGYTSCEATAKGKLWSAARGWFHQCAIDKDDVATVYIWG